ncbi:MAG: HK97 family phage prohead protease [Mesorhizobium sp.]|uniref:HK97 family phage prohead protease n=1 Tax=unclassified Mesorhizobium TaxID=325217 RepID=UPI000F755BB4|nr:MULTISPECIES: HK97 family phage prohead protease [unclassified Mesorhizobium]RVC58073.1 HK97 family phage prohead protease [Mesorhizobium sp. M2A.F.Ca.ET.046.02.1.1]AZO38809.1 HK97 family phage prohead protease [Mesorhizobium sp. M2A.F.Ca.ET.046.03.2.1]RWB43560.1 MAG: HK97 family phage prohead protease [Mesorhizobium sp.]RWE20408.1 MAG: HK97 family phage prohead protease [Mesorhizobium sp.]RWF03152.1 MAG: HK97 family phage prohead protease [Mesorhizobium sp.]
MDKLFLETKFVAGNAGEIEGLAWPFGSPDRVGDVIEKGAFANVNLPLTMLFGHDQNDPIGVWTEAVEAPDGLRLKGKLLVEHVERAREVRALVQSGAVRGISIGFITRKAMARKGGGRTISQLQLLEASLVTLPMHPGARVTSAKSAVQALAIADAINRATAHFFQEV